MRNTCKIWLSIAAAPAIVPVPAWAQSALYLRVGAGLAEAWDARVRDADCTITAPPALFGCGAGSDGKPLGAEVDFDAGAIGEVALGMQVAKTLRSELLFGVTAPQTLRGQANFLRAGESQPVAATVKAFSIMGAIYWDLPKIAAIKPFVGGGLGVSRTRVSATTYSFPALTASARTVVPSGSNSNLAAMLTVGISLPLSNMLTVEAAYRYIDLGTVRSSPSEALIVRQSGTRAIAIGATQARLRTGGATLSIRRKL